MFDKTELKNQWFRKKLPYLYTKDGCVYSKVFFGGGEITNAS